MSRYIDADDVANAIYHYFPSVRTMADARGVIDEAPSIDIVRCENCRDCKEISRDCPSGYGYLYCKQRCSVVNEDDFCAWGTAK